MLPGNVKQDAGEAAPGGCASGRAGKRAVGPTACDGLCSCSAHALTADVSVAQTAAAAQLFLADGVVLTGTATGHPADPQQLRGEGWHTRPGQQGAGGKG